MTMSEMVSISIILPTLNEEESLKVLVPDITKILRDEDYEVINVDPKFIKSKFNNLWKKSKVKRLYKKFKISGIIKIKVKFFLNKCFRLIFFIFMIVI